MLLAGLGVAGFAVTRGTARDQERRLLEERAGEVAVLLTSATSSTASTLGLRGRHPRPGPAAAVRRRQRLPDKAVRRPGAPAHHRRRRRRMTTIGRPGGHRTRTTP